MDNPSDNRCAALRQAPDAQVSKLREVLKSGYALAEQSSPGFRVKILSETIRAALDGMDHSQGGL